MLLKIAQFSSHFSSSSHRFNTIPLSQIKQPSPLSISFKFGTLIRHIVAYLNPNFGDVSAEFEGVMHDNIARNGSKSLVISTA